MALIIDGYIGGTVFRIEVRRIEALEYKQPDNHWEHPEADPDQEREYVVYRAILSEKNDPHVRYLKHRYGDGALVLGAKALDIYARAVQPEAFV